MKDEEIKAEMEKYTEALKQKFKGFDYDPEDEEKKEEFFRQAKENAHKVAIECLNKILTPELKIFKLHSSSGDPSPSPFPSPSLTSNIKLS